MVERNYGDRIKCKSSVNFGFAFFNTSKIVFERFGVKHGSDSFEECE